MSVNVFTYSEPKNWKRHPAYSSFPEAIHICATNNQKDGIKSYYGNELKHIYSFRKFARKLYSNWYSPETKFQQYLRLSKIIAESNQSQMELQKAFRANTMDLLESIRFFAEAFVDPQGLDDKWLSTEKERFFKKVWTDFLLQDIPLQEHYSNLQSSISLLKLEKTIQELSESEVSLNKDVCIVLHGFYFVTPEQQVILQNLKRNFNLIFFHYYESDYPKSFDFIKAFVNERFGWPSPNQWKYDVVTGQVTTNLAEKFLSSYEKSRKNYPNLIKNITSYSSFFEFSHDIVLPNFPNDGQEKGEIEIFSPNAIQLNNLITSYYPELGRKKRNFLSYPVGRFLVNLHDIFNGGNYYLNEEILLEIFSSGWIQDNMTRENAQKYTYDLRQIFPYFKDCKDFKSWKERLEELIKQGLMLEEAFPMPYENRIIRSMRSPFSKISHFAVPLPRLKQINVFIENLQTIVSELFEQAGSTNIDQHFRRLKEIIKNHSSDKLLVWDENEKQLIKELEKKIDNVKDSSEFLYEDLQDALHFYLSGKLDEDDENYIIDLVEIDGEMFKDKDHDLFLTGLDENSMPIGTPKIPWPLQEDTFNILSEYYLPLQLLTIRSLANKSISRYLFFIALNLQRKNVKLSWIKNLLDQINMQPALYIKQLGLTEVNYTALEVHKEVKYTPFEFSTIEIEENSLKEGWKTLGFEDFLAEYKLCPKRFYYSYILDEYPAFSSDFIHHFMFSEIFKISAQSSKDSFENVLSEVSPFFPQWLNFKKRIAAKTAYKYIPSNLGAKTEVLESISYTEARKKFQFPGLTNQKRNKIFEETKNSLEVAITELVDVNNVTLAAKPGYECRFCPHVDYCEEAALSIDLSKGVAEA